MNNFVIRAAKIDDAEAIFDLLTQFAVSYKPNRSTFNEHLPQLIESPTADLLVAVLDEIVVGYALAFRLLTFYANGPITEIQELMVEPQHRGRGIGKRLVETVVESARTNGCCEVTVPTRRARDYYRKLGFEETASYFKRKLLFE